MTFWKSRSSQQSYECQKPITDCIWMRVVSIHSWSISQRKFCCGVYVNWFWPGVESDKKNTFSISEHTVLFIYYDTRALLGLHTSLAEKNIINWEVLMVDESMIFYWPDSTLDVMPKLISWVYWRLEQLLLFTFPASKIHSRE